MQFYVILRNYYLLCPCSIREIMKKERKNKKIKQINKNNKEKEYSFKKQSINNEKNNSHFSSNETPIDKNKMPNSSQNINNYTIVMEKDYKYDNSVILKNKDYRNNNKYKEKIKFWNYLIYKLSFGKKINNNNIKLFENFRIKIISVENIINNYLLFKY